MLGISQKKKLENLVALISITHQKIRCKYAHLFPDKYALYRLALVMANIIVINEMVPKSWINPKSRFSWTIRNNSEAKSKMLISREITMRSLNVFSLYLKSYKKDLSDRLTPYVLSAYEYCYSPCCEIASKDWPRELYGHFSERTIDKLNFFINHSQGIENPLEKYDLLTQLIAFRKWNITKNIQTKIDLKVVDYMNSDLFYLVRNLIDELDLKYREQDPKSLVTISINEKWNLDPDNSTNLKLREPIDQTGFRGIKWNAPFTNFEEEFSFKKEICLNDFFHSSGNTDLLCNAYCRKDYLFYIGNANVNYIYYLFSDNKFVGILSDSETKEDCSNLLTTLMIYLGNPNKEITTASETIYQWNGNGGHVFYQCFGNAIGHLSMFPSKLVLLHDLRVKHI